MFQTNSDEMHQWAVLAGYNEAVRRIAKAEKIPLIDVHAAYAEFAARQKTTIDTLLLDGMHPADAGHELVAELLTPVIREQFR